MSANAQGPKGEVCGKGRHVQVQGPEGWDSNGFWSLDLAVRAGCQSEAALTPRAWLQCCIPDG